LKEDFPHLQFTINGGIETYEQMESHLKVVPGVMIGRAAYKYPWKYERKKKKKILSFQN
jgi:tRNA-dihydrouridine synthase A